MTRTLIAAALVAASSLALAQQPAAPTAAAAPVSAAKKELVARVIKLQQPGIDAVAIQLVQNPARQMMQAAGNALQQRVAPERRQALAADIQADLRKYAEDVTPMARERAARLAPTVLGPILEEKFSEDELKQLIAIIDSPINRKYQSLGGDMMKSLTEKLVAELQPSIEPKLKALQQTIGGRLNPAAGASAPAPK